jgi:small-conductance mechanosensitive channel
MRSRFAFLAIVMTVVLAAGTTTLRAEPVVPGGVDSIVPGAVRDTLVASTDTLASVFEPPATALDTLLHAIGVGKAGLDPRRVLVGGGLFLLYTLLLVLGVRLVRAGGVRWRSGLVRVLRGRVAAVRIRGFEVISVGNITRVLATVLGRLDVVAYVILGYVWLSLVLELFPGTRGWSGHLTQAAASRMLQALRAIVAALPGLAMIAVIGLVFRWLMRLSDRLFDAVDAGALVLPGLHPDLAAPSKRLVRIALWIVAIALAYPHIPGSQTRTVQGISILIGLMASFGSSGFVSNVLAGIVLTYSRAFQVGDRVRIGEHVGDIVSLGFLATKLRTIRNEEVTLPNGQVTSGAVMNFTRLAGDPGLILYTSVTIGYDVEWRKVHALLVEAAGRVEGVEATPEPWVFQRSLNDSHVSYELNCVTHLSHPQLRLYSDLHREIQDAFARAGIEILSPMYHAMRDANATVLPDAPAGPRDAPGGFRVRSPGG